MGRKFIFWEDIWLGNASLREQYPGLYNIVRDKNNTTAQVLSSFPPNISFRRDLIGPPTCVMASSFIPAGFD